MARDLIKASSQYLENANAVLTAYPFTVHARVQAASYHDGTIFAITDTGGDTNFHRVRCRNVGGVTNNFGAESNDGVSGTAQQTNSGLNTWLSVLVYFRADNSRGIQINAGGVNNNTTTVNPAGLDLTSMGGLRSLTPGDYFDGKIADVAIWNIDLSAIASSDLDIQQMFQVGVSPLFIRPESLVAYWPLLGATSPEIDHIGGFDMTITGSAASDHPVLYLPQEVGVPLAGTFTPPMPQGGGLFSARLMGVT